MLPSVVSSSMPMLHWACLYRLTLVTVGPNKLLQHVQTQCASHAFSTAALPSGGPDRGGKDRSRQLPALVRYGRDLTEEARRQLLDPVIGRQDVIQRTMQVLLRRTKHNPLLIGEAGVGKTAIVEGIAQLMAATNPPKGLSGKRLVALDVAAVVAGSTYRGEFEERLQSLLHDCETAQGSVVLFIDEIHVLVGAGNVEGGLDFANMLKPALARSQLQVIGATTLDEYRQHIETDPALSRRFQPILVEEPTAQECLQLLEGLAPRYETFHGVSLPHDTLATAVAAAQRYIPERRLPDSAIDLIDEAAAKVRLATAYTDSKGTPSSSSSSSSSSGSIQQQQQQQQQGQPAQVESDLSSRQAGFWEEWQQASSDNSSTLPDGNSSAVSKASSHGTNSSSSSMAAARAGSTTQKLNQPLQQQQQQQHQQQQQQQLPPGQSGIRSVDPGPSSAQTWSGWVQAKGWRGEAEVHRQQLLEWFGASPDKPLKGSAGHQQTTHERRKKHQQLFGDGARPDFTGSAALPPPTRTQSQPAAAAAAGPQKAATDTTGLPSLGTTGPLDYTAKPCPHCGTVVLPAHCPDPVRLQCGHCGFRFLNVAPEKLQLGTTVLMDKQQYGPWYAFPQQQQQQQHGWDEKQAVHRVSLADTPADVAAAAALGGATATSHAVPPARRTAVAVQERQTGGTADVQDLSSAQQRWEQQQQYYNQQQQLQQQLQLLLSSSAGTSSSSGSSPVPRGRSNAGAGVGGGPSVSAADILQVVSEATGIPQHLLTGLPAAAAAAAGGQQLSGGTATAAALQELSAVQSVLQSAVQGQQAAVAAIIGALRLSRMGLAPHQHNPQQLNQSAGSARPALSLLFQGPSGVGKTTMAKTLAEALLPGEPQGMLVFSCGELSERHSISRLVGAPPGYVGYGRGGLLTEAVRRRPHSCVVFDDIERAHPDVVGLLLQAVEDGYLMDSLGHTINLRSTVFIFTANTNRPAVVPAAAAAAAPGPPAPRSASAGSSSTQVAGLGAGAVAAGGPQAVCGLHTHSSSHAPGPPWDNSNSSSSSSSCSSSRVGGVAGCRGFYSVGGSGSEGAELEPDEPAAPAAPEAAAAAPGDPSAPISSSSSTTGGRPGGAKDAMISELGSRVDDIIHFEPLNNVSMTAIVHQQLQQAVQQAKQQGVLLQVDPAAAAWLASSGCSDSQGARPLVQLIRRHVLVPLAAAVMDAVAGGGQLHGGGQGEGMWAVAVFAMPPGSAGVRSVVPELQLQKLQ